MKSGVDLVKEYLNNFPTYADRRYSPGAKEGHLYTETKSKIQQVIDIGNAGQLGRLFNQYPLRYDLEDKSESNEKTYYFVDPKIANYWPEAYEAILTQNEFTVFFDQGQEANKYLLTEKGKDQVRAIVQQMIDYAVDVFLNENGRLNQFLIDYAQLQPVLNAINNHVLKYEDVINQILFGYIIQVVNTDILMPLYDKYQNVGERELDYKTKAFKQLQAITDFSTSLVASRDARNIWHFTDFFKNAILLRLVTKSIYSEESFANFLKYLSPEKIAMLVSHDLGNIHQDLGTGKLANEVFLARGDFWISVLKSLQHTRNIVEMQAIYLALPEIVRSKWEAGDNTLSLNVASDHLGLDAYRRLVVENEQKNEAKNNNEPNFEFWLNTRDNRFLVNHLRRQESGNSSQGLKELFDAQFEEVLVSLPTRNFLLTVLGQSKHQKEILEILGKYFPELASELNAKIIDSTEQLLLDIKLKNWPKVVEGLLSKNDKSDITQEVWDSLMENRKDLLLAFKDRLNKLGSDQDKLQLLDKTIAGDNLLGQLFKNAYSGWGLFLSPFAKKDEQGNKIPTSMSELLSLREQLQSKDLKPNL